VVFTVSARTAQAGLRNAQIINDSINQTISRTILTA